MEDTRSSTMGKTLSKLGVNVPKMAKKGITFNGKPQLRTMLRWLTPELKTLSINMRATT